MKDYGFGTFDTDIQCEELADAELYQLMERHPELFADPLVLTEEFAAEEATLP
jgi:hypothetical protein